MADYEIDVLVNGKPIKQFRHKGTRFIEGRKGSDFELRFTNNTWKRVEIVASVDGLNVISGKPCGTESEGYLVPSHESIVIPGWRLNNDAVAKFVFNDKNRSYTAQMGHGKQNAGVIGFMVFEEEYSIISIPTPIIPHSHPHPWSWPKPNPITPTIPWQPCEPFWTTSIITGGPLMGSVTTDSININTLGSNATAVSADLEETTSLKSKSFGATANVVDSREQETEQFALGTGWGSEQEHHVNMVDFTRLDPANPTKILSIFYDTRKGLENRGIKVVQMKKKRVKNLPNAFPTYSETGATPPPGWKGKKRK